MMQLWAIPQYEFASSIMERKDPHRKQAKGKEEMLFEWSLSFLGRIKSVLHHETFDEQDLLFVRY